MLATLKIPMIFLGKVKGMRVGLQASFFSLDVESLYTNIETERGLAAVEACLRKYPQEGRPDGALLRLLELSLIIIKLFNNRHFLQVKGTAMGKRFAPAYGNIYMLEWEESVFPKCETLPAQYWRYLDDI